MSIILPDTFELVPLSCLKDIIAYPNPAYQVVNVTLKFTKPNDHLDLNIVNLQGQSLIQKTERFARPTEHWSGQIDIGQLREGMYIIKARGGVEIQYKLLEVIGQK